MFVADDLGAWLVGLLADAARRKLTALTLGDDQQRALRKAAAAAIRRTTAELCPGDSKRAAAMARAITEALGRPVPEIPPGQDTLLGAMETAIAARLAACQTVPGVPAGAVAASLTRHLMFQIKERGARGGPLTPLASQINSDESARRDLRLGDMFSSLASQTHEVLTQLGATSAMSAFAQPDDARTTAVRPTQLPPKAGGFTGRHDELALLASLLDPSGAVAVTAVVGLPGVGKTSLAVQAGHAALGWYPGGVLFIDLHGYDEAPVGPDDALFSLLLRLGVPARDMPSGTEERAALYRSALAGSAEPVLVIADNASSEGQVRPLLPGAGPHKVLVTSRDTLAGLNARIIDLTVLGPDEGVAMLDAVLRAARPEDDRISADPDAARSLASACGGLPLALWITAARLTQDPALSAAEAAQQLRDAPRLLDRLSYDDGSGPGAPSVAAAFELSYRALDDAAARVFRLLPVNPGPDVSTAAVAALAGMPAGEVRPLLGRLARAHLAEADPGSGRWHLHDLLNLYAWRLSGEHAEADDRQQAWDRLGDHYLAMTHAAVARLLAVPGEAVPGQFAGRDDARAWLDAERYSLIGTVMASCDRGSEEGGIRLAGVLADYLVSSPPYEDMLAVARVRLDMARSLGYRSDEGGSLRMLGAAQRKLERHDEAITAYSEAVAIFRQADSKEPMAQTLADLGWTLLEARRLDEASTAFQEAVTVFRQTGNAAGEGRALCWLGLGWAEAGRREDAVKTIRDGAAILRDAGDTAGEAAACVALGMALGGAERYSEAITAFRDALRLCRQSGAGENYALQELGVALALAERYDEAIIAYREAVAGFSSAGDLDAQGHALTLLGEALDNTQQYGEAAAAYREAAAICGQAGDQDIAGSGLARVGWELHGAQRLGEAIAAYREAAGIHRKTGNRSLEGVARHNLGTALADAWRWDEAISAVAGAAALFREAGDQAREDEATAWMEEARAGRPWLTPQAADDSSAATAGPPGTQFVETRHGLAAYDVMGDGDPVILLHGGGADRHDYDELRALLPGRFRSVAVDWPGHGDSPAFRPRASAMRLADAAEDVVYQLAPSGAVLVGSSVGGFAAAMLAIRRPGLVRGLVILNGSGFSGSGLLLRHIWGEFAEDWLLRASYAAFLKIALRARSDSARRAVERRRRLIRSDEGIELLRDLFYTYSDARVPDLRAEAGEITCPTLLIWGRRGWAIPARTGRTAARLIPGARLVVLNTGHVPCLSDPEGAAAALIPFADASFGREPEPRPAACP